MKPNPSISRREFLKRSTLAASAIVGAPAIVPSSVFGADGQVAPSNRITIGFIGTGKMAHDYHLSTLSGFKDVECVAVCDVDTNRRLHAKKVIEDRYTKDGRSNKGIADYNDFRELIARKDIDAVCIATPDHWHAIPVIEACKAKLDIYCEKPLSLTIAEARAMANAVRQHDRVFQTGSMQRSSNEFLKACELVRNGRIGKVQEVYVSVGNPSQWCDLPEEEMEPGLDWDRWLGPAPKRAYNSVLSPRGVHKHFPNWRNYREYSGGMMTDWDV